MSNNKKINVSDILMSVLPLVIMLILNTVATFPALVIGMAEAAADGVQITPDNTTACLGYPKAQIALTIGFLIYAIISIVVFGIWYKKALLKNQKSLSNKEVFTGKNIILAGVSALGLWGFVNIALTLISMVFPDPIDAFGNMMENSVGSNIIISLFYGCILGPIAEELIFRAVTYGYLKRSKLNIIAVIVIQGILFGIAHMNPVQSIYASFIGFFYGFLRYKFGNIRITCFAHILNNTAAFFLEPLFINSPLGETLFFIFCAILAVAGIVASVFIAKMPATSTEKPVADIVQA